MLTLPGDGENDQVYFRAFYPIPYLYDNDFKFKKVLVLVTLLLLHPFWVL